jgi:hypothetical protein
MEKNGKDVNCTDKIWKNIMSENKLDNLSQMEATDN